jgi:dynein heavy chain
MLLMAAMGLPVGGRNQISDRLLSRFNVINMTFPSETQIGRIFGTLLKQHVAEFEEEVRMTGKQNMTCGLETSFTICYFLHFYGATGFYKCLKADISKVHLHRTVLKSAHIVAGCIYMKNVLRIN